MIKRRSGEPLSTPQRREMRADLNEAGGIRRAGIMADAKRTIVTESMAALAALASDGADVRRLSPRDYAFRKRYALKLFARSIHPRP